MATETIKVTESKQQPGKQEYKEETKGETAEGVRYETKHEHKTHTALEEDATSRIAHGQAIVHRNVMWALGAGVLPFPGFDIVAVMGVELKMLKELSDLYGVPFKESIAKKIIYSLLTGVGSVALGVAVGSSFAKLFPAIGTTIGVISVPIFAGAFTHAIGKVFLMHFESGGTFLDFDPRAMHVHFKREYETGRQHVERIQKEEVRVSGKP
jgi:uncharacterized protein (DUF697 family)